jgi:hypothetical protein
MKPGGRAEQGALSRARGLHLASVTFLTSRARGIHARCVRPPNGGEASRGRGAVCISYACGPAGAGMWKVLARARSREWRRLRGRKFHVDWPAVWWG